MPKASTEVLPPSPKPLVVTASQVTPSAVRHTCPGAPLQPVPAYSCPLNSIRSVIAGLVVSPPKPISLAGSQVTPSGVRQTRPPVSQLETPAYSCPLKTSSALTPVLAFDPKPLMLSCSQPGTPGANFCTRWLKVSAM